MVPLNYGIAHWRLHSLKGTPQDGFERAVALIKEGLALWDHMDPQLRAGMAKELREVRAEMAEHGPMPEFEVPETA